MTFALDSRLQQDTVLFGRNGDALLLLMNDSRYPWFVVVPTFPDLSEWFDLPAELQSRLHSQCVQLGKCVQQAYDCEKINVAALGNIVRQMHIHVVGRFKDDPAWPGPVWGHSAGTPYSEHELIARKELLWAQKDLPFNSL